MVPLFQRQGVGARLMQRFLQDAKKRGCRRVTLEAALAHQVGLCFFAKWGFNRPRTLKAYYSPSHDGLRLTRDL